MKHKELNRETIISLFVKKRSILFCSPLLYGHMNTISHICILCSLRMFLKKYIISFFGNSEQNCSFCSLFQNVEI